MPKLVKLFWYQVTAVPFHPVRSSDVVERRKKHNEAMLKPKF